MGHTHTAGPVSVIRTYIWDIHIRQDLCPSLDIHMGYTHTAGPVSVIALVNLL